MLSVPRLIGNLSKGNRPYVLSLILLNLFFFSDALFTADTFFYRDIGNFHQPLKKLVTEAYSRGEWPLWNPYIQFGQPLLANPNAMAVYPTQLLFHLFPFDFAFDLNLVLHCLIAGLGAFYLARSLNMSPVAALAAGIAYNFNGVTLSLINLPNLAAIGGLIPWLALLLRRVVRRPSAANLAFSSILVGLLLLLPEPLATYAVLLFLVPFGVYSFLGRPAGVPALRIALALLIILVSGFCLAGVQILPTLELVQNSGREQGLPFDTASFWSVHPFSLTQMLFPQVWKDTFDLTGAQSAWSTPLFGAREAYFVSCYAGLSCLMFALLGLFFSAQRRLKWILLSVCFASLALALGKYIPLYSFLFDYLPPLRAGRYPAKYLLTIAVCLSLLAGLGVDELTQLRRRLEVRGGTRRLVLCVVLVVSILIGSGLLAGNWLWEKAGFRVVHNVIKLTYQAGPVDLSQPLLRDSILYLWLVLGAGLLLVLFASSGSKRASWTPIVAIVLVFFDLLSNHFVNPLIRQDAYTASPVTKWLVNQMPTERISRVYHLPGPESPYRILGTTDSHIWQFLFYRWSAAPYTGVSHHIQYSTFMPVDRLETLKSQIIDWQIRETHNLATKLGYLAELNTGYVLSMNPIDSPELEWQQSFQLNSDRLLQIYRLKSAKPRAYLADLPEASSSRGGQGQGYYPPATPVNGLLHITSYGASAVQLSATVTKPSMLVLLDSYYPGWEVRVDGRLREVETVNGAFRGTIIQPGEHQVTFRYNPQSFRYGLALTLSTIAAWVAALLFLYGRRNARRKKQPASIPEAELVNS